jgi:hypothetical protein
MTVTAVIGQPAVVRQILAHLGLPSVAPSLRALPAESDKPGMALPPRDWVYQPFLENLPAPEPVLG